MKKGITIHHTILTFDRLEKEAFLKTLCEKGENAGNQHFLLFPQCFLPFLKQTLIFQSRLFCHLQCLYFDQCKNVLFGEE